MPIEIEPCLPDPAWNWLMMEENFLFRVPMVPRFLPPTVPVRDCTAFPASESGMAMIADILRSASKRALSLLAPLA